MNERPVPTQAQLAELHQSGLLAQELGSYHEGDASGSDTFAQTCAKAHNDGSIDLLAAACHPAFDALDTHAFFAAQHVYCDAIPDLQADADALMACCRILVTRAGNDGMAGMPNAAFTKWCAKNTEQCSRIIDDALQGKQLAMDFATFALVASNDASKALAFLNQCTDERRLYGMTALGRMTYQDAAAAQKALTALEPYLSSPDDDRLRANALAGVMGILAGYPDAATAQRVMAAVSQEPGPQTLHALAECLLRRDVPLDRLTTKAALGALLHTPKESGGTVRTLSHALYRMLDTADEDLALDALSDMLRDGSWAIKHFSTLLHKISSGEPARRDLLAVRWLLSGSVPLGDAVRQLAKERSGLGLDMVLPALSEPEQLLLCEKAVGFLFLKPRSCCSILVAVLRQGSEASREAAGKLLVNPLLSYASAREHLMGLPESDAAYALVQKVLERFSEYRTALDGVPDIKELYPTERQRHLVRVREREMMRDAMKGAEQHSLLRSIAHTSHILYGRRTLAYFEGPGGERKAIPMDLNKHSTSMELPTLEWVDPVGLSNMLLAYRVRKPA